MAAKKAALVLVINAAFINLFKLWQQADRAWSNRQSP